MTPQDWKIVLSFGLLTGALTLFEPALAMKVVTVAAIVVIVRHAGAIEGIL